MCVNSIERFSIQVKIDIYYESLCPDSVRFISQQLYPLYSNFKKHLDITFIPFGKSNVSFECNKLIKMSKLILSGF